MGGASSNTNSSNEPCTSKRLQPPSKKVFDTHRKAFAHTPTSYAKYLKIILNPRDESEENNVSSYTKLKDILYPQRTPNKSYLNSKSPSFGNRSRKSKDIQNTSGKSVNIPSSGSDMPTLHEVDSLYDNIRGETAVIEKQPVQHIISELSSTSEPKLKLYKCGSVGEHSNSSEASGQSLR
jgi:hypothetical protein